jgi:KaiC/GvpD/RAD55 family RecA-like ATPase
MATMKDRGRRPKRLEMVSLGKLRKMKFAPREYVIGPWLREGESAMLWAPAGLGKSMLALTIALAVSGGGKVCGWTFDKPRPVLVLDGEMNIQDLQERLEMLSGTIDGLDLEAADRNLQVLCRQHQHPDVRFPDLATPEGHNDVVTRALGMRAALVICDNFSTLADVADENEAAAMQPVLQFLLRMKQAGIATILVHHSDKGENNYRGSSKLATTFEAIVGLWRIDGRSALEGTGFELRFGKFRGRPTAATMDAEMTLMEVPDGGIKWHIAPATSSEIQMLIGAARTGEFQSQAELARHFGWEEYKVTRIKKRAISRGVITEAQWKGCFVPDSDDF